MTQRVADFERKSKETHIQAHLNIDGRGVAQIKTQIGLLDHMLELMAFHGNFDLTLEVKQADLKIDIHHTNEDTGIVLGKLFKKALGDKIGIKRFGWASVPMEATVGTVVLDINGRGYFKIGSGLDETWPASKPQEGYEMQHLEHFMESFAHGLGMTANVKIENAVEDIHTNLETVFKALGLALDQATQVDTRKSGVIPSTKGIID